jgi:hypothetical protein
MSKECAGLVMMGDKDEGSTYSIFFILLILFSIFVLGDIITTTWLIHNDPAGISNEGNPFGIMFYSTYGIGGLLLAKMIFFLPFSILVITWESKYYKIKWFHQSSEVIVLGLIAYSLIIFLNNLIAIIIISASKGLLFLLQLLPIMKFLIIIFSIALTAALFSISGLKSRMKYSEVVIGTIIIIIPTLLYETLNIFIIVTPIYLIAYIGSILIILSIAFYIINEIVRERRPKLPQVKTR